MMKARSVKRIVAVLLLPFCWGAVRALGRVLGATGREEELWLVLAGGAACWWVVYLLLPKPMWVYVVGHEFTHALWTWLFFGRVKRFKVSSKGGHVVVTRNNFLITLAPYFFPVYVVAVVLVFSLGQLLWDWRGSLVWFHFLVGAAYGFHLTLTWHILQRRQSDITSQGIFFSAVVIFLGNTAVLLLGLPLLSRGIGVVTAMSWWWRESLGVWSRIGAVL